MTHRRGRCAPGSATTWRRSPGPSSRSWCSGSASPPASSRWCRACRSSTSTRFTCPPGGSGWAAETATAGPTGRPAAGRSTRMSSTPWGRAATRVATRAPSRAESASSAPPPGSRVPAPAGPSAACGTIGRMRLRIFTEPQQGASYATLRRVAKATEDLGFDAFFRSDHYLKMGGVSGEPGPSDAWTTLAGLAVETSRIRLGTLVTSATFRYPGPLAIAVAGADEMSGGRVEFGIGAGWYAAEHDAYGIPLPATKERFDRLEEQLAIITGLWMTP